MQSVLSSSPFLQPLVVCFLTVFLQQQWWHSYLKTINWVDVADNFVDEKRKQEAVFGKFSKKDIPILMKSTQIAALWTVLASIWH